MLAATKLYLNSSVPFIKSSNKSDDILGNIHLNSLPGSLGSGSALQSYINRPSWVVTFEGLPFHGFGSQDNFVGLYFHGIFGISSYTV